MDYSSLVDPVRKIAADAASFIKSNFGKVSEDNIEHKSLNSLVSYVDKEAERMIVRGLMGLVSNAEFLTEEETIDQKVSSKKWIIDPLDGTTNFLHGLPFFAVSIALEVEKEIVLGVVFEVNNNECFYAHKGGGAYLNKQEIKVSTSTMLKDCVIATGFPYHDYSKVKIYLDTLDYFMQNTRGIRRFGSAALDLCYVASGRFDAFFEYGLNPWDVAAGILIVEEAGGKLSDFKGSNSHYDGNQIIASAPGVFEEFSSAIQKRFGPLI